MELAYIQRKDTLLPTKKLARVAETSSIEHSSKTKVSASTEVYDKKCHPRQFSNR